MESTYPRRLKPSTDNFVYGKVPPQAVEVEKALLGSIMLVNAFNDVAELVNEKCFYSDAHQKIFGAMQALSNSSRPIDILTVSEQLKTSGEFEKVGGAYYITSLTNGVVSGTNNKEYCRLILQAYMKREIIRISGELINGGYEDISDPFELLEKAESGLFGVRQLIDQRTYKPIASVLVETFKHLESIRHRQDHLTGITSGFFELDKVTCGWQDTDLIILAARPSVGKTAITLNLALNAAKTVPVGFFSLEMSERQLVQRCLSAESGILLWNIRNGKLDDSQMKAIYEGGIKPIGKRSVFIDDTANIKLSELKAKARRMVRKDHVKIIFIDYLQLITAGGNFTRKDLEVGHVTSQLKGLAKDLNIPIVALSQLSRGVEQRGSTGEPKLSDLRESGAIEQDADIVMFLWKPSESEIIENPELGQYCNVKIEKHRNGTLERFLGKFAKEIQKWETLKVLDNSGMPMGENWKPIKTWNND